MMSLKYGRIGGAHSTRWTAGRVLRIVLATAVGLVVAAVALLVAALVGAAFVVRRLLGGRRSAASARFGAGPAAAGQLFRAAASRQPASHGEVIDIEAREVDDRKG